MPPRVGPRSPIDIRDQVFRSISAREFDERIFVAQQAAEAIEAEGDLGSGLPAGASERGAATQPFLADLGERIVTGLAPGDLPEGLREVESELLFVPALPERDGQARHPRQDRRGIVGSADGLDAERSSVDSEGEISPETGEACR